jgi:proteasome accessory factor A
VLNALEKDPMSLADRLDWAAKKKLLMDFMDAEGTSWHDDVMFSLDMEYHNINRQTGLYYALEQAGLIQQVVTEEQIQQAVEHAPTGTRAAGREIVVRNLLSRSGRKRYVIDWDGIYMGRDQCLEMADPFHTYTREAALFLDRV